TRYEGEKTEGYQIENLKVKVRKWHTVGPIITDTRMQVWLDEPLAAKGGKVEISMDFTYDIPTTGVDRMGILEAKETDIFAIAQWYPQMAVLDDVVGWNTDPYLGAGEFYLGYGDFDYKITVPYDHIVVGSGELQHPKAVLTRVQRERLKVAASSDASVCMISPEARGSMRASSNAADMQTGNAR